MEDFPRVTCRCSTIESTAPCFPGPCILLVAPRKTLTSLALLPGFWMLEILLLVRFSSLGDLSESCSSKYLFHADNSQIYIYSQVLSLLSSKLIDKIPLGGLVNIPSHPSLLYSQLSPPQLMVTQSQSLPLSSLSLTLTLRMALPPFHLEGKSAYFSPPPVLIPGPNCLHCLPGLLHILRSSSQLLLFPS